MKETTLLGEKIEYEVKRSDKATIPRIDIDLNGVRVILPRNSEINPERFLDQKSIQVIENIQKYKEYKKKIPERKFQQNEKYPFLGTKHTLTITEDTNKPIAQNKNIHLPLKQTQQNGIKNTLKKFYKKEARKQIKKYLNKYSHLNLDYNQLKLKNQKTRWGSCSSKNNLNINWRIVMAPPEIIEYIVVHELIHLEEKNHTKKFWSKIANTLPDYKKRAEWLEKNSPKLIFSKSDY